MNEKSSIIDLIIHDLTGPLSIVATSTESLLKKEGRYGPLSDRQREALERILRNSTKAQRLLQEMIEVYRSEEGLFRSDAIALDRSLRTALLDAVEIVDPALGDRLARAGSPVELVAMLEEEGISVAITGRYRDSTFCHDEKKIEQILRNLISNAMKYRKKAVKVSLAGEGDLVVTVTDDGEGIPAEKQGYIFKRFFPVKDKPGNDMQKGLGFGLSCVKKLVETMNGDISVTSGEGRGTCFALRIPPLEPKT